MISKPYSRSQINVQRIVGCTDAPTQTLAIGGDPIIFTTGAMGNVLTIADCEQNTALHIDVDKEGVVPMVVREQGYEWVPVYTRKLA